jgi:hypothetical protein
LEGVGSPGGGAVPRGEAPADASAGAVQCCAVTKSGISARAEASRTVRIVCVPINRSSIAWVAANGSARALFDVFGIPTVSESGRGTKTLATSV